MLLALVVTRCSPRRCRREAAVFPEMVLLVMVRVLPAVATYTAAACHEPAVYSRDGAIGHGEGAASSPHRRRYRRRYSPRWCYWSR